MNNRKTETNREKEGHQKWKIEKTMKQIMANNENLKTEGKIMNSNEKKQNEW